MHTSAPDLRRLGTFSRKTIGHPGHFGFSWEPHSSVPDDMLTLCSTVALHPLCDTQHLPFCRRVRSSFIHQQGPGQECQIVGRFAPLALAVTLLEVKGYSERFDTVIRLLRYAQ